MNKLIFTILFTAFCCTLHAQKKEQSAAEFQQELVEDYKNPEKSPLKQKAKKFKGHEFFKIDSAYRVEATFVRALNALPFRMKTSSSALPVYEKYGEAVFYLEGEKLTLSIYQNHSLREQEEYKNHLFLPFTDATNGEETYLGGRYIDLEIPEGNTIVIDFNKAYNPYCAYADGYSCPIPPKENGLQVKILAGIKKPKK
jgi:uncharacterized protein (DUF1684 family)